MLLRRVCHRKELNGSAEYQIGRNRGREWDNRRSEAIRSIPLVSTSHTVGLNTLDLKEKKGDTRSDVLLDE